MLIGKTGHNKLHAVFVQHAIAENVELKRAHNADDGFLHAKGGVLEYLNGALPGNLLNSLDKLLALHGVLGAGGHKVLRLKGGNAGKTEFFPRHGYGVANGKNARVKNADYVAGVCLLDDFALRRHNVLGLRKAHFLVALNVVNLGVALKFAGTDAHKGKPVAVRLVHVRLNFEYEGGKIVRKGVDFSAVRNARSGGRSHAKKFVKKRLHAEIGQCGTKENRA